jgi:dTDP-4-dehydrorhamnose reductase
MTVSRVAVLGAGGQIGRALVERLGDRAMPFTSAEINLLYPENACILLAAGQPDAVINAAAYTQVDKAESERELCHKINALAPGVLAEWCAARNIPFVHYSTDYVFDGSGARPWRENDVSSPRNVYGHSKWEGEKAIAHAGGKYLIFRTSWIYADQGVNFLTKMLELGAERESLKVVADQFGAPCYAPYIAYATISCLDKALQMEVFPAGVYHMATRGETSWHGFAEAIFAEAREAGMDLRIKTVEPVSSLSYPTLAVRPKNSRLDTAKLQSVFGETLPAWQTGLSEVMEKKRASNHLSD